MAFGYDPVVGWRSATYEQLLKDLQTKYLAQTSDNVDVENGPPADMSRTLALMFRDAWEDAEGAYNAKFVGGAPGTNGVPEGSSLELLLVPYIGPKLAATSSTVVLPLTAAAGPDINIPAGSKVRLSTETETWEIAAPVLIPGGGSIDATFTFSSTGPKSVVPGSSWAIATPVSGWLSAGPNALAAIPGRFAETDAEYRQRFRESLADNTVAAVRAVAGVTSVSVIEWPWGFPDGFWGATHWIELLVVGGSDADVAAAIQRTRAKGVNPLGNTEVEVPVSYYVGGTSKNGFSRPVLVQAYAEVTITKGEGYPADTSVAAVDARKQAVRLAVVAHVNALGAGQNTSGFKVAAYIQANTGIPGIDNLVVKIDTINPPVNTGTLAVAIREQLTITDLQVTVIGA